jgi:hypothetical protein
MSGFVMLLGFQSLDMSFAYVSELTLLTEHSKATLSLLLWPSRRLSAEDLRKGLGAVGRQMDSESVKKLARELDVSGCGSVNLEVRTWQNTSECKIMAPCTKH